jgi:hypothetical protein
MIPYGIIIIAGWVLLCCNPTSKDIDEFHSFFVKWDDRSGRRRKSGFPLDVKLFSAINTCSIFSSMDCMVRVHSLTPILDYLFFGVLVWISCLGSQRKHGGFAALMFQDGNPIVGDALLKINPSHIWFFYLGQFNVLYKNKHDHLCKFRLWFYFLFSCVLLELD